MPGAETLTLGRQNNSNITGTKGMQGARETPLPLPQERGISGGAGRSDLEGVLFAGAAKSSRGTTVRNLLEASTPAAEFSRLLNAVAGNNHPRAGIITSPAEKTGFRPGFKGHAHFSFHAPP